MSNLEGAPNGAQTKQVDDSLQRIIPACPVTVIATSDADNFRKRAENARQLAAKAVNPLDGAAWLHLAEDWLKLAQEADKRTGKRR